jgi:hypothetical protein
MVDGEQIHGDGVNVDGAKTPPLFPMHGNSRTAAGQALGLREVCRVGSGSDSA